MSLVFLKLSFWLAFWELGFHKDSCIALRVCISGGGPTVMARPGPEVSGPFTDPTSLSPLSAGAQDVRVRAAAEVRGHLGDTVELPCHLLPPAPEIRVSQVTWLRLDAPEGNQNVAIFHPQYGPSFPSPKPGKERLSFVNAGQSTGAGQGTELEVRDATLALRGLTVEDEGNYTCEFATFPRGTSRGVTWLRVIGEQGWGQGCNEVGRSGMQCTRVPQRSVSPL